MSKRPRRNHSAAFKAKGAIKTIAEGRFASPDDIAKAILFLADPERSGFVNGHALVVDGGWTTDASWQSLRMGHR